jgi:hypothetical protein
LSGGPRVDINRSRLLQECDERIELRVSHPGRNDEVLFGNRMSLAIHTPPRMQLVTPVGGREGPQEDQ